MPTSRDHLIWGEKNEALAYTFYTDEPLEVNWAITILFYAAVHYVDAYLVQFRRKQSDHEGREKEIQLDDHLSTIWIPYRKLKHLSRAARYDCAPYTSVELLRARVHLAQVKTLIYERLKIEPPTKTF